MVRMSWPSPSERVRVGRLEGSRTVSATGLVEGSDLAAMSLAGRCRGARGNEGNQIACDQLVFTFGRRGCQSLNKMQCVEVSLVPEVKVWERGRDTDSRLDSAKIVSGGRIFHK